MRVKTSFVPEDVEYLTVGKEYKIISNITEHLLTIVDDEGDEIDVLITGCAYLDGLPWEIIK